MMLNFEKFLDEELQSQIKNNINLYDKVNEIKAEMVTQRNGRLCNSLMLCANQDQIEMFIYILYKYKNQISKYAIEGS